MVDIQSATTKNRTAAAKYNGLPYWAGTKTVKLMQHASTAAAEPAAATKKQVVIEF